MGDLHIKNQVKQLNYWKLFLKEKQRFVYSIIHTIFSGYGQTIVIASLFPWVQHEFDLTNEQFGKYYSLVTILSAFTFQWFGKFIDTVYLKKYSLLTAFILVSGYTTLAISSWLPLTFLGIFLLRLAGQAVLSHIAMTSITRFYDRERGKALAFANLGHGLGEAIFPSLILLLASLPLLGMRFSVALFALLAGLGLLLANLFLLRKDNEFCQPIFIKKSHTHANQLQHEIRRLVLHDPFFYGIMLLGILPAMLMTGFFLYQSKISTYKGWEPLFLTTIYASFVTAKIVFGFIVGLLIDKFRAINLYVWYCVPMIIGFLCLHFIDHILGAFLYLFLSGVTIGFGGQLKSALLSEVYVVEFVGTIRSMAGSVLVFSTAISPWLFGYLVDHGHTWGELLLVGSFTTTAITILNYFLLKTKKQELQKSIV